MSLIELNKPLDSPLDTHSSWSKVQAFCAFSVGDGSCPWNVIEMYVFSVRHFCLSLSLCVSLCLSLTLSTSVSLPLSHTPSLYLSSSPSLSLCLSMSVSHSISVSPFLSLYFFVSRSHSHSLSLSRSLSLSDHFMVRGGKIKVCFVLFCLHSYVF